MPHFLMQTSRCLRVDVQARQVGPCICPCAAARLPKPQEATQKDRQGGTTRAEPGTLLASLLWAPESHRQFQREEQRVAAVLQHSLVLSAWGPASRGKKATGVVEPSKVDHRGLQCRRLHHQVHLAQHPPLDPRAALLQQSKPQQLQPEQRGQVEPRLLRTHSKQAPAVTLEAKLVETLLWRQTAWAFDWNRAGCHSCQRCWSPRCPMKLPAS